MPIKIFLAGFMGSGKSTFFHRHQSFFMHQGFACLETDPCLLNQYHFPTVASWFKLQGEEHFRHCEYQLIESLLNNQQSIFVAMGGGTLNPLTAAKMQASPSAKVIWIDTSWEVIWERLQLDPGDRPLFNSDYECLKKLYDSRLVNYRQAHLRLNEIEQVQMTANEILSRLIPR